jgi:hypothetical protein
MSTFLPRQPHLTPFVPETKVRLQIHITSPGSSLTLSETNKPFDSNTQAFRNSTNLAQRPSDPQLTIIRNANLVPQKPPRYTVPCQNVRTPLQIQRQDDLRRLLGRRRACPQET